MLYIVATPIWNLWDITYRAVETLKWVDSIACEDTRTSSVLLNHYEIKKPLVSFHSHSGVAKIERIIEQLKAWDDIALISDAGTPGFSDPGYVLIKQAIMDWIDVVPIPGVTAFATALMGSGLPMNHFLYLGFLPIKKWRQTLLIDIAERKKKKNAETVVIYESVHRIEKTVVQLGEYLWEDHQIVIGRELTKKFEQFIRWNCWEVAEYFKSNPGKIKGEFVIMM